MNIIQDIAGKNQIVTRIQRETNADPKNTQDGASVDFGVGLRDFKQGWSEPKEKTMGGKKSRAKGLETMTGGKELEVGPQIVNGPKQGCWTRLANRATVEGDHEMHESELGYKRKISLGNTGEMFEG